MMVIRRIWAIISERDFYAFQTRARKDGVSMGSALAAVARAYARGADFDMTKAKSNYEKMHTGVDYIKEHRLADVDKSLVGEEDK
jgi:hypothetical protein